MRASKLAIAAALAADPAVAALVPESQIFAVERATLPTLPAVELVGVTSERQDTGPLVRHELSIEITVSHASEDGADTLLDSIVAAVRSRLSDAEVESRPITLPDGSVVVIGLAGTRWSVSASDPSGVIRGAAVSLTVEVDE